MRIPAKSKVVDLARRWLPARSASSPKDCLYAFVLLGVALSAGALVHPFVKERIFITIFPVLAVTSVWCGLAPAVGTALIGGLAAALLWMPDARQWPPSPDLAVNLVVFWTMGAVIILFGSLVRILLDELRTREREAELRAQELRHRVQNIFALIGAMGRASAPLATSVDGFWKTMQDRLKGLSDAQYLLTEPELGADFETLLRQILAGHGLERYRLFGEPCLVRTSTEVVLALHELSTNATKYGALSTPGGYVEIEWQYRLGKIRIVWSEHGGPTILPPERLGFGSLVLRGVEADLSFDRGGLVAKFQVPGGIYIPGERPLAAPAEIKSANHAGSIVIERHDGFYMGRVGARWLPGVYATEEAVRFALQLPDRVLRLVAEERSGGRDAALDLPTLGETRRRWLADDI